jgi:hypothetical protein
MEAHGPLLSVLVALDAALLLILAGLAKKQLQWGRPATQPASRRRLGDPAARRRAMGAPPRWLRGASIAVCVAGVLAAVAGIAGLVTPAAALAYLTAAACALLATR